MICLGQRSTGRRAPQGACAWCVSRRAGAVFLASRQRACPGVFRNLSQASGPSGKPCGCSSARACSGAGVLVVVWGLLSVCCGSGVARHPGEAAFQGDPNAPR